MTNFSLCWDAQKAIWCGLSSLQQSEEFVDMTLAADGHMVKVHQLVIALASPYLKELISSAKCPHPVIFLNKISYETLSSILEYIYTGEAIISSENLNQFVEAGKALHIKGIAGMSIHETAVEADESMNHIDDGDEICYFEVEAADAGAMKMELEDQITKNVSDSADDIIQTVMRESNVPNTNVKIISDKNSPNIKDLPESAKMMQYTISNQGSLQMILNRFVYYLKYTNRGNVRKWRCVDYLNKEKCPACVITKGDIVKKRVGVHVHPFHDKKILKKINSGTIFSAINDAESEGKAVKGSLPARKSAFQIMATSLDDTSNVFDIDEIQSDSAINISNENNELTLS